MSKRALIGNRSFVVIVTSCCCAYGRQSGQRGGKGHEESFIERWISVQILMYSNNFALWFFRSSPIVVCMRKDKAGVSAQTKAASSYANPRQSGHTCEKDEARKSTTGRGSSLLTLPRGRDQAEFELLTFFLPT